MKKNLIFTAAACCALLVPAAASAQEETIVVEETAVVTEVPCKTHYYVNNGDNWFIQFGAGFNAPFVEGLKNGEHHSSLSMNYNFGFGRWFSPYLGFRLSFQGGPIHWHDINSNFCKFKTVTANVDLMWDMFNTFGGVNENRVFSLVPFVGIGGTYGWDFQPSADVNVRSNDSGTKTNMWTLPVSAGLQARLRLCKYVDFFAEARANFYGDTFNNCVYGNPIDVNVTLTGGFTITFGGRKYQKYNPCDYLGYIDNLNGQVNDLRSNLATTAAALAAAEAQLPCPEVTAAPAPAAEAAPLMATVRFRINSARISDEEMVNVYNISEWMKANPNQNVAIVGYADKDTGTSEYNLGLSRRRAQAVYDTLVNNYGINPDRLSMDAEGSDVQPYEINNWNRIVIFK